MSPSGDVPGPLSGLQVIELGGVGPVPFTAMMLADLGAGVIRIQRPDGSGVPNAVLDRGRRSIAVNLKDPRGVDVVLSAIDQADVLLEGFRPGVAERLGFDPASLIARNPKLVVGRMTGFGQDGPLAQRAGHDINYIALSGALAAIGRPGQPPTVPLNLVGDFGGGGMLLAVGVLAAVIEARISGRGQVVDASMVEGSGLLMAMMYGKLASSTWVVERGENLFDGGAPFYDVYECGDGRYVSVGAIEPPFFVALVEALGLSESIDAARQLDRATWPAMRTCFRDAFKSATSAEWVERFAGKDVCVTPVLTMTEAAEHPQNAHRRSFLHDANGVLQPAPAPRFSVTPGGDPRPAPVPGQHTREVLAALGHPSAVVDRMLAEGVVCCADPKNGEN